ncbi:proline-rich protein 25 [Onychomys torridus]|uniref:proline-rich protein 25 n=1 Tax=Onychomys torridus TaxID=38674 RepID=UPI00167FD81C|nr:proline-rich protein 25 [Onychomys torridus]
MAVGAQGPQRSEHATPPRWGHSPRGGRRRGARGRASLSSTPVARGPQFSTREGPGTVPGRAQRPRLRPTRRRRGPQTAPGHPGTVRCPQPQGPELTAVRPLSRPPVPPPGAALDGSRSAESETEGRANRQAPGLAAAAAAAGARALLRPVNNAARQLGPARAEGKGGADCGWEGTVRSSEARRGDKPAERGEAWPGLAMPRLLASSCAAPNFGGPGRTRGSPNSDTPQMPILKGDSGRPTSSLPSELLPSSMAHTSFQATATCSQCRRLCSLA